MLNPLSALQASHKGKKCNVQMTWAASQLARNAAALEGSLPLSAQMNQTGVYLALHSASQLFAYLQRKHSLWNDWQQMF